MAFTLPGTTPIADIVRRGGEELGQARAAKVGALVNDAKCSLRGGSYLVVHLLPASGMIGTVMTGTAKGAGRL
jgi:hypothetical protein